MMTNIQNLYLYFIFPLQNFVNILQVEKDSLFYIVESVEKEKALSDVILKGESSQWRHPQRRKFSVTSSSKEKALSDVIL